ncbi:hypothetical protein [Lactobacillus sp. Sy-1]|uniref:hypothetical protein n=1 Tax=Lactobacillus sp. Sy-1 TaxID=2109645 RepID=UPI001C5B14BE|nr:hypothetical protein [Lactobacillus sp. Sy-1]MBW1606379.1 hypothetical protein [Lactobacillus sp. Sy-1]
MEKTHSIGNFKITYDNEDTPLVLNHDQMEVIFLDYAYSSVVLKIKLVDEQLSFTIPNASPVQDAVQILRVSDVEYRIATE